MAGADESLKSFGKKRGNGSMEGRETVARRMEVGKGKKRCVEFFRIRRVKLTAQLMCIDHLRNSISYEKTLISKWVLC
jgi:hypothetical protein